MFNTSTIVKSLFWRFAERCGAQLVTFIVSIVLARLLSPRRLRHHRAGNGVYNDLAGFCGQWSGHSIDPEKGR